MEESKGRLLLAGFELDEAEKAIVDNTIKNYEHKIGERFRYDYIKLRLRRSSRGKSVLNEVEGSIKAGNKLFNSKTTDYNLFAAVAEVLEKLLHEMTHKLRKAKEK